MKKTPELRIVPTDEETINLIRELLAADYRRRWKRAKIGGAIVVVLFALADLLSLLTIWGIIVLVGVAIEYWRTEERVKWLNGQIWDLVPELKKTARNPSADVRVPGWHEDRYQTAALVARHL